MEGWVGLGPHFYHWTAGRTEALPILRGRKAWVALDLSLKSYPKDPDIMSYPLKDPDLSPIESTAGWAQHLIGELLFIAHQITTYW